MKILRKNKEHLEKARSLIPLASQTLSKSYIRFPEDFPNFISHADGARVVDLDGNEYVDLINALGAVVLGYRDLDVDKAVKRVIDHGSIYSLSSTLETELAELLIDLIPCAEMVRFCKNGSDATSGAIRLARSVTGSDIVFTNGYHGWHDWAIEWNAAKEYGVPDIGITYYFDGNEDLKNRLKDLDHEVAAVIIDTMHYDGDLEELKKIVHDHGAILVFDEILSGFRMSLGGIQEMENVVPDLATFGKAMGNGYPIACLVGRKDLMKEMDKIFFTGTYFGDNIGLAASIATITKMRNINATDKLWKLGRDITAYLERFTADHELREFISIKGPAVMFDVVFKEEWMKILCQMEMLHKGNVLWHGRSNNVSLAYNYSDISQIQKAYECGFKAIKEELRRKNL